MRFQCSLVAKILTEVLGTLPTLIGSLGERVLILRAMARVNCIGAMRNYFRLVTGLQLRVVIMYVANCHYELTKEPAHKRMESLIEF